MISVCLATYNGEKFIKNQLISILNQLGLEDEVIVSDDTSSDKTLSIIEKINDPRIKIFKENKFHSPTKNFENALIRSKGDYIFLADQDDIWMPNRVEKALKVLRKKNVECVICNRIIIDENGISDALPVVLEDFTKKSFIRVLLNNPYIGCCMAFTRSHLEMALPFPKKLPMHDLWIGLLAHKQKVVSYIPEPLIAYRRHGDNVTTGKSPYSIWYRIWYRIKLVGQINHRLRICK